MSNDRFLLIRTNSHSLWRDIDQLAEFLLIAELTNRIPVIHWDNNHLLNPDSNAFDMYFEPVSPYNINSLTNPEYTFYPKKWKYDNLLINDDTSSNNDYFNIGDMFESEANVVVCDSYTDMLPLISSYIGTEHSGYGMNPMQLKRYLFDKYLKLKPDILAEIEQFSTRHFKGNEPVLAVHVREDINVNSFSHVFTDPSFDKYSSKEVEVHNISETVKLHDIKRVYKVADVQEANKLYHKEIQKYLGRFNIKKLFLLTDCEEIVEEYKKIYGSILVVSDATRYSKLDKETPYIDTHISKRSRGIEILKDTYLATKCDFFIGNGLSNLSHAVTRLKNWSNTNIKLLYWYTNDKDYNYYEVNSTVYPDNAFVGYYKQLMFLIIKLVEHFKQK